jgi:UPF0755 protein
MSKRRNKKERAKAKKILILLSAAIVLVVAISGFSLWRTFYASAIKTELPDDGYFYVQTGETYSDVLERFKEKGIVKDVNLLDWTLRKKNYPNMVKAGRFKLSPKMSLVDIANLLRSGNQSPVRLTLRSQKNFSELANVLAQHLEPDLHLWQTAFDELKLRGIDGVTGDAVYTYILPNTYEIFWNTKPYQFIERMQREHNKFWSRNGREEKAKSLGMSKAEVQIMASIVQKESNKSDELNRIAGVYYNRIKKRMLLQADPTLVYIVNQDGGEVKRVLNKDKKLDHPYNTYKYLGLPPGAICMASAKSIDAVLNLEKHNYLYFCAREDFSGYHNFASSYTAHLRNARVYQQALNKRKIYR